MAVTLRDLRAHLVSCFEPGVRIVGNTTAGEICDAIDAMINARNEACAIANHWLNIGGAHEHHGDRERLAALRKVGSE